jgi:hypothetical protein
MNDRKRAWQILRKEILRVADGTPTDDAWANEMAAIMRGAERITDVVFVAPVSVPWVGSRRSLPAAQQSCAQHARQLASEGGATSEQTPGREVREGGGSAARALDAGPTLYISTTPRTTWVWAEDIAAVKVVLGQEGSDWFTARRTGRSGTGSQIEFNAVDVEIGCVPAASGLDKLVAAGYRLRRHPECPQTTSPVWGAEVDCGPGVGPWEPPPLRGHQER